MATSSASLTSTSPPSAAPSSFLPLTTVFPVPTSCLTEIYTKFWGSPYITAFRDYNALQSQCYPESYSQFEYPTTSAGSSWYSPGVCPSGYTIASSLYDDEASATRAWCCPGPANKEKVPTFPWGGNGGRAVCISTVTESTSLVASQTTILTDFFLAYDWPISIMWAESDLTKFTPMSAPLLVNDASTASPTRLSKTSTSIPSSTSTPLPPGPPHLSTGAKAGIGVGVTVLALALIAAGLVFYRRRKAKQRQQPAEIARVVPVADIDPRKRAEYLPRISEMDSNDTRFPQHMNRAELDGHALPAYQPYRPNI